MRRPSPPTVKCIYTVRLRHLRTTQPLHYFLRINCIGTSIWISRLQMQLCEAPLTIAAAVFLIELIWFVSGKFHNANGRDV